MLCRTVKKWIDDYVDGHLAPGREVRLADHLRRCTDCHLLESELRFVSSALDAWTEEPAPEEGLHRLETSLAVMSPAPAPFERGRLKTFVLPYVAGLATAALVLLFVMPLLRAKGGVGADKRIGIVSPPNGREVVDGAGGLLSGERILEPVRFVDSRGQLRELSAENADLLRREMGTDRWVELMRQLRLPSATPSPAMGRETRPVIWEER